MHRVEITGRSLSSPADYDLFTDSPEPDADLLRRGMVPPLPIRQGTLVWGFSLVRAAEELGIPELPATEVTGDDIGLLALAVKLEGRRDAFSLREKAGIFTFLRRRNITARAEELSPYVQSEGSFVKQAEKYLALTERPRELVDRGEIDLKTAGLMSRFSGETTGLLADLLASCSVSRRRTALRQFYEITIRDTLFGEDAAALARRLASEKDPLTALEVLRYPRMTEMKESFNEITSRVLAGSGIQLTEPPGFEGSRFSVSFYFSGPGQLDRVISRLRDLQEESDELFGLLR